MDTDAGELLHNYSRERFGANQTPIKNPDQQDQFPDNGFSKFPSPEPRIWMRRSIGFTLAGIGRILLCTYTVYVPNCVVSGKGRSDGILHRFAVYNFYTIIEI